MFPIMVGAIAIIIELGMMMTQWNLFTKAAQIGARKLVVSEPMMDQGSFNAEFAFDSTKGGEVIRPDATERISCAGTACPEAKMDWLLNGSGVPNPAWRGIRRVYGGIDPEHITVTYETSGLGYEGRPTGPVVSVKLEIDGDAFEIPVVSALMDLGDIDFPSINASATSEDLCGAQTVC